VDQDAGVASLKAVSIFLCGLALSGCALGDVSVRMTAPNSIEVFVPDFHSNPSRAEDLARQHCLKNGKSSFSITGSRRASSSTDDGTAYLFQCD